MYKYLSIFCCFITFCLLFALTCNPIFTYREQISWVEQCLSQIVLHLFTLYTCITIRDAPRVRRSSVVLTVMKASVSAADVFNITIGRNIVAEDPHVSQAIIHCRAGVSTRVQTSDPSTRWQHLQNTTTKTTMKIWKRPSQKRNWWDQPEVEWWC